MRTHSLDTYQIGIICALSKELKAVRAILDEEHALLKSKDAQDHNSYVLGEVGVHNVVVAGLPAGVYGTTSAASVGSDMLRTFPQLRFGLLVGIGGGVPNNKERCDVRLGDVVVSQPNKSLGGVVQYDCIKLLSDGRIEQIGSLNKPPQALLTALTHLRSSLDQSEIERHLEDVDRRHPSLREHGYTDPGPKQDRLHCTRCDPSRWWWILWVLLMWLWPLWRCDDCDYGLVRRASRRKLGPTVHYGTIASANTLLKNAQKRDQLGGEIGALCVEMEAAGLMDSFPCLVIRGICDYADAYKNDVWQEYAALAAAVVAQQLLGYITPQMTKHEKPARDVLDGLHQFLQHEEEHRVRQEAFYKQQEVHYQGERHRNCHRVFKTSEYEDHKNINPDAVPGTCRWVLDHPHYQNWLSSKGDDLLWISADPGCGKSVLSKSLVDAHLGHHGEGTSVCYFFFKDNEQQDGISAALCAILHQLFSHQCNLIHRALPAFDKDGDKLQRDTHELWRILQNTAGDASARPIICVLDALDECREVDRQQLISLLSHAHIASRARPNTTTSGSLKWLVTSRPYDDIRDRFEVIPPDLPSIRLRGEDESEHIRGEINLVICQRVKELSLELRLSVDKTEMVLQQLLSIDHRTYLWLYLAINAIRDSFRDAIRPSDEEIVLVPATVEQAYERILMRVSGSQTSNARAALTIIVGARRPLTIEEMALALDIATLSYTPTTTTQLTIDVTQLGDRIRRWCGLFVLISSGRLYLLHQTAKEFLLSHGNQLVPNCTSWKHCLSFLEVEKQMAIICIRFLCLSEFNEQRDLDVKQDREVSGPQTFFNYSAEHWASHAQPIETHLDSRTKASMQALYDVSSKRWTRWTSTMWQTTKYKYRQGFRMNCIQLAAFNGHSLPLQKLLSVSPKEVDSRGDGRDATGLIWASERGSIEVAQMLLDAGADVNAQGGEYSTTLQAASANGHDKVVQMLLDARADVNAQGGHFSTALQAASAGGHDKVVQMLLDARADVNAQGRGGIVHGTALQAASANGHNKVVQMLLDAGANVKIQGGGEYGTALQAASANGHDEVVQMLLDAGANVKVQGGGKYGTALQAASARGHDKVVRMLLDAGADVSAQGGHYNTALRAASANGHDKIVQMLLDAGANVKIQREEKYGTALLAASVNGHDKVVRMLLDAGADVNVQGGGYYNTALRTASVKGHDKVVRMLLDAGADVNEQGGGYYATALQAASAEDHDKVVQMLLDAGADVNAQGGHFSTALQAASAEGHGKVVQMLLDAGADVNAQGGGGPYSTALQAASARDHDKVIQMLVDAGADVKLQEKFHDARSMQ